MAKLYAARGVQDVAELSQSLNDLLRPEGLKDIQAASELIVAAITAQQQVLIVADYDCDGATACAVAIRGLVLLGLARQRISFIVPDRAKQGYGLSDALAREVIALKPDLVITVDNGVSSVSGVKLLRDAGIRVLVTDHHLPGDQLAPAHALVNPNQPGCTFASKAIAGVGVMFYVLLAARAALKLRQEDHGQTEMPLAPLLDLVALGTVADLVPLDANNRILVAAGLKRIRNGQGHAGIRALLHVAGKHSRDMSLRDFGFLIGPRLNAAGRLADMSLGIQCLLADEEDTALALAQALEEINQERKQLQLQMTEQASVPGVEPDSHGLVVWQDDWHQGVVGLVATRLKDRWACPTIALAPSEPGSNEWRGSGRSVPGIHLRDVLDYVAKQHHGLIEKFGGHAMAAGLTLRAESIDLFRKAFNEAVRRFCGPTLPTLDLLTDGELAPDLVNLRTAHLISKGIWGQRFEAPRFEALVEVEKQLILKEKHLKAWLKPLVVKGPQRAPTWVAMRFFNPEPIPRRCRIGYSLTVDEFQGLESVTLQLEFVEAA